MEVEGRGGGNIYFSFGWKVQEGEGGSGVPKVDLVGSF